MDSISDALLGHLRSFLSFREAHVSKTVSKRWNTLEKTTLALHIRFPPTPLIRIPPVHAVFHRLTHLSVRLDQASSTGKHMYNFAMHHILNACKNNLLSLRVTCGNSSWANHMFPLMSTKFTKVEKFTIFDLHGLIWNLMKTNIPQVKSVHFHTLRLGQFLDFSSTPNMQTLVLPGNYVAIQNFPIRSDCKVQVYNMRSGVLQTYYDLTTQRQNLQICIDRFLSLRIKASMTISSFEITFWEVTENGNFKEDIQTLIQEIKELGTLKINVHKSVPKALLGHLILTNEFSREEIKAML